MKRTTSAKTSSKTSPKKTGTKAFSRFAKPDAKKPFGKPSAARSEETSTKGGKRPERRTAKNFEPDPKDANTVQTIRAKLSQIQEYKKILAEDGLMPDAEDKEMESDLIRQLIRIEKGLTPKAPFKKKKKPKRNNYETFDEKEVDAPKPVRDAKPRDSKKRPNSGSRY